MYRRKLSKNRCRVSQPQLYQEGNHRTKKHQVVKLQERFKALVTEQVYVLINQHIEKLKRRDHILPYRVSEVITAQLELGVDRGEMILDLAQLILNASEAQTQWSYDHVQR